VLKSKITVNKIMMKTRKYLKKLHINKNKKMEKTTKIILKIVKMNKMEAMKMKYNNHQIMMVLRENLMIKNKKEKV
jgi:hypothetical protein